MPMVLLYFKRMRVGLQYIVLGLCAIWLAGQPAFSQPIIKPNTQTQPPANHKPNATIHTQRFRLQVVQTKPEQQKGLAGREHIAKNFGMLFVYTQKKRYAFWMRGMLSPIDIIWLDNRRVVHIEHAVPAPAKNTPNHQLVVYKPPRAANLVLEIAAGRAKQLGLKVGDTIGLEF